MHCFVNIAHLRKMAELDFGIVEMQKPNKEKTILNTYFQSTEKMLNFDVILINFNKTLCSQLQHDNEHIFRKKRVFISEQINITIMLSRWPTHGHSLDFRVYLKHVVRDC